MGPDGKMRLCIGLGRILFEHFTSKGEAIGTDRCDFPRQGHEGNPKSFFPSWEGGFSALERETRLRASRPSDVKSKRIWLGIPHTPVSLPPTFAPSPRLCMPSPKDRQQRRL